MPSFETIPEGFALRAPTVEDAGAIAGLGNEAAGRLFVSLGYRHARTFWMMRVDFGEARVKGPDPIWRRDPVVRPRLRRGAVYEAPGRRSTTIGWAVPQLRAVGASEHRGRRRVDGPPGGTLGIFGS
jgi:hypothetical protein